jgi:four helix bundle protein
MNDGNQKIKSFTDLNAWKEAHKLVLSTYEMTRRFPKEETYGLTGQMRRAAVSITSNIAEGFSRRSYSEKGQFYSIAQGSNTELQNQLIIAKDIDYIDSEKFETVSAQLIVVHKLLNGLIKKSKDIHNS